MKPYQARGSDRGFTLVELLVGVVVSGLVALFLFWMVAQDARFKALERARAGVRDKVQLAIDLFQEDFRGIESTDGLEARPGSFYVQSDKGLLTLNWGVRFKRWLYLSESGRPGFQPLWVVWGAKKGSRPDPYWTLYRIVHREAYGRMIEVSRLELKPLTRAELHLFGLNERAEPGPGALVRLDKTYPYSVPSSKLERLAYAELEIDALAQTGASQRMLGTFGQNYRPYRFVARAQPRNIDAAFINPKPLSGVSLPPPKAESDAMDRVDYIAEGVKTVTIEALQAGLQVIQLAATLATTVTAPTAAVGVAAGAGTAATGVAVGVGAGAVTAVPTLGVGAVAGAGTAATGAAAGAGIAATGAAVGTGGLASLGGLALSSATKLIVPIVETFIDKLSDWLIKPVLRATTTPGVVAYCTAALSNPISLGGSGAGAEGASTQPQGGGVPKGVGLGVGGTPPGLGGTQPSVQALEEMNAASDALPSGNRSGLKVREAGPSRGDFLPGQSQGQGFAFGRAGKSQKTGGSQGQQEPSQEGAQQEPATEEASGSDETTGIQFIPTAQNPYLALLGLPLNAGLDQNRQAALTFEGNTFASQDWGKVFVFAPYFMPGQSTPTHPMPINKGEPFDIQVLNSMENVTVGDLLAAMFAALPFSRNAYVATLPFLKLLRTTAEGINMLVQTLGQATSLLGGGESGTSAASPAPTS